MKLPSLILLSLVCAVANSNAALALNVATNPNTGAYFVLSDGTTRLPDGNLVRIGTFATAPAADASAATLAAAFTEYGTTTSGHSAAAGANKGMINRSGVAAGAGVNETNFTGKNVYLWVYNAPTAAAATQWGVYGSTDASWKFAASVDDPPVSASTSLITNAYGKALTQAAVTTGTPNVYKLANAVPETSTFSLTALAALGLMRRKRQSA
jgi:hypothetical protein